MKDLEQILQLWDSARNAGVEAVLATVVKTQGSSYRLPGARLLLTSTGQRAGSISGGCLEDDLVKKAWWLTESGALVRRYDTTPDGEIAAAYGLGCNGIIHVLLQRAAGAAPELELIRRVRSERRAGVIAHCIAPHSAVGQRLCIGPAGQLTHNLTNAALANRIEREAKDTLAERHSRTLQLENGSEVFIETIVPAVRLLVFGAGDDAVPLVTFAKYLGWQVSVLDGRAHYARRDKFPHADEIVVRPAGDFRAEVDPWTVAVLMSHSYTQDLQNLRELASQPLRYLGALGPRKRTVQLLSDTGLAEESLAPALHTPMGLDIGADGPEQVALAVLAEIQATLNGREGGQLRTRPGSIHASEETWVHSIACA